MEMQFCIIFVYFSDCCWDFTKAWLKQNSLFSSSQSHSSYLHAKLKFTWPMLSYNQTAYRKEHLCCTLLNAKIFKKEIKRSLLVRETVAPLVVSDERSGKSNLSHAVVNPRPCVRIIMKLVFPSKFPIIRGTSSVCVKLYINIIF